MRVKTISRSADVYERQTVNESNRVFHNLDPEVHPFERAREYQRALNGVKLEKVFAKPFVRSLGGHLEGVFSMAKHSTRIGCVVSGACDGEIRVWNAATGQCNVSIKVEQRYYFFFYCSHFLLVQRLLIAVSFAV